MKVCSFILLIFLSEIFHCNATVSDKQYASLPELFHQDNFDNCMLLQDEAFYCSITYVLEPIDKKRPPELWSILKNVSEIPTNYRHDRLRHSICVPHTCPGVQMAEDDDPELKKGLEECYDKKYKRLGLKGSVSEIDCQTQYSKYPIDWFDILCGLLMTMYISFVLYATYTEGIARYKTPEEYQKFTSTPRGKYLSAFSVTRNWIRLKTINSTPEIEKLRCIQGIRVYNTAIVLSSHTLLSLLVVPIINTRYPETMHGKYATLFFASGPLCVSTFFFISSFLLANGLFEYMKDKNGLSWKMIAFAFANRLFRLTPTVLVMILFYATWYRHLGSGPLWNFITAPEFKNCRKNGWLNLIYLNNWINQYKMCHPVTWYLGLDTQYFILVLLLIWLMKAYEKYVWFIIGGALTCNIVGTFIQNYYHDFSALVVPSPEIYYGLKPLVANFQSHNQLGSFIGNMAGPIIGVAFGYYFFNHKNDKPEERVFRNKFRVTLWWIMSYGFSLTYIIIPGSLILHDSTEHNAFWASVYVALSRPIFAFAIGTGIYGLIEGIGWLTLRVCQWTPTYVLGRLSFSAYLIHMPIVIGRSALSRSSVYISDYKVVSTFFGDLVMVYIGSTILTLLIELPVSEMQKFIFVQKPKKEEIEKEKKAE